MELREKLLESSVSGFELLLPSYTASLAKTGKSSTMLYEAEAVRVIGYPSTTYRHR